MIKPWAWWALPALAWGMASAPAPQPDVLLVAGDFQGYLTPCGCVKPMTGGIARLGTAVRSLSPKKGALRITSGNLSAGSTRQDELKAEALVEALTKMEFQAIHSGQGDARLSPEIRQGLERLSKGRLFGPGAKRITVAPGVVSVRADTGIPASTAGVAIFDGGLADCRAWVQRAGWTGIAVYRSTGKPPEQPEKVGRAWLITPGDKGKYLLRIGMKAGKPTSYGVAPLGPQYADDAGSRAVLNRYLTRVTHEQLLERMPRDESEAYAGSKACMSCHAEDYKIWSSTRHAKALETLEKEKHDRDPDCVGCHVVGLEHEGGFTSRAATPDLKGVGCESCHGPSAKHVQNPEVRTPKKAFEACLSCHDVNHSPGFDAQTYWPKIKHGVDKSVENRSKK